MEASDLAFFLVIAPQAMKPKPIASMAQVDGSGMALEAMLALKPVIEDPRRKAKFAVTVKLKKLLELKQ